MAKRKKMRSSSPSDPQPPNLPSPSDPQLPNLHSPSVKPAEPQHPNLASMSYKPAEPQHPNLASPSAPKPPKPPPTEQQWAAFKAVVNPTFNDIIPHFEPADFCKEWLRLRLKDIKKGLKFPKKKNKGVVRNRDKDVRPPLGKRSKTVHISDQADLRRDPRVLLCSPLPSKTVHDQPDLLPDLRLLRPPLSSASSSFSGRPQAIDDAGVDD